MAAAFLKQQVQRLNGGIMADMATEGYVLAAESLEQPPTAFEGLVDMEVAKLKSAAAAEADAEMQDCEQKHIAMAKQRAVWQEQRLRDEATLSAAQKQVASARTEASSSKTPGKPVSEHATRRKQELVDELQASIQEAEAEISRLATAHLVRVECAAYDEREIEVLQKEISSQ